MSSISIPIDNANIDDEIKSIKKSTFLIKNLSLLSLHIILSILIIIFLSIVRNLAMGLYPISIFAISLFICTRCITICIKLKTHDFQSKPKNILTYIVKGISISLTLFISLYVTYIMASLNFGYDAFVTFFVFTLICIWILNSMIYILIIIIHFLWKKSLLIRQQLSFEIISFFLASFLICFLFMYIIGIPLGLGLAFTLSIILFVGGLIGIILYRSKKLKFISSLLWSIGCIGIIFIYRFYFNDGHDMKINVIIPSERFPNNLTHDPSLNGNYSYSFLTYGSGFDHRIDYGKNASIITPTIDLSSLIQISSFNKKLFKYNESNLPLNGRIWYPTNKTGPYPIVVMVHGNHISTESSEIGYEYLGTMLASQGFIAVSVDENFLNVALLTSSTNYGKISKIKKYILDSNLGPEYMARAIILLETLKQFRIWNEEKTNPFYHEFDLSNIGLMGHSRGGEAIVIAYIFNQLKYLPDYPSNILFNNYNFKIKVLFSISGTEDGYMLLGRSLQFSDVTLFAIHGIYDGDITQFLFQSKITNLKFTSNNTYNFKASLYVHQANHGQFNSKWGRYDVSSGTNRLMNVHPLMKMNEQQHICKIYMSALMKIVLKNEKDYRIIFEDYRSIINYLPHTNYISTFQDSNEIIIADFENFDVTKGTITGSNINITNLLVWSSVYIKMYRSTMLLLQPIENFNGIYRINLQNSINGSSLRFMIARTSEGLVDYLTVRVFYEIGTLDSFNVRVLPALTKKIYKISSEEYVIAVQTISLPLLHPIIGIEFVVNGTNAQFLIDNLVIVK